MSRPPSLTAAEAVRGDAEARMIQTATAATALVMATLSAHAPTLPLHVIKAAAIAAGNATIQRNPS